jgi:hypothetical protein
MRDFSQNIPTIADVEPTIEREFGSRLEPLGFQRLGERKWIRSQKLPIRELFVIGTLKGARYSPAWGLSCGFSPSLRGKTFRRQTTDKNAGMDLIIDPIDISGDVPPQVFGFISGHDTQVPKEKIRVCAEHFIPQALADFDRVHSVKDFCHLFLERSQLQYRRFGFYNYIQHQLVQGFVLILTGHREQGVTTIREFCESAEMDFDDKVLSEQIRAAEAYGKTV